MAEQCLNHPGVASSERCVACAEPFCPNCLVEVDGKKYCGSCKVVAASPTAGVPVGTEAYKLPGEALTYSIIGIFCFGIILEPIAISKAIKARKAIAENPRLEGLGKANAALIIGIAALILWVLGVLSRFAQYSQ